MADREKKEGKANTKIWTSWGQKKRFGINLLRTIIWWKKQGAQAKPFLKAHKSRNFIKEVNVNFLRSAFLIEQIQWQLLGRIN